MKHPGQAGWGAEYAAAGEYLKRKRKERQQQPAGWQPYASPPPNGSGRVPRPPYASVPPARPYAGVPRTGASGYRSPGAPAGGRGWGAGAVVAAVLSGLVLLVALALLVALVVR